MKLFEMYSMVKTGSMKLFEMCSMVPAGEYSGTLQGPWKSVPLKRMSHLSDVVFGWVGKENYKRASEVPHIKILL